MKDLSAADYYIHHFFVYKYIQFYKIFGGFPAKIGVRIPPDGPVSKNAAERTESQPRGPTIMPSRARP